MNTVLVYIIFLLVVYRYYNNLRAYIHISLFIIQCKS